MRMMPRQGGKELAQKQAQELQAVLKQFGDIICVTTGKAHDTDHGLKLGSTCPLDQFHIGWHQWKEQLHADVLSLLEHGIIRPSLGPWSSPIVPVMKPDSSIRLCIDFRKVNSITQNAIMSLIVDLIDQLGEANFLSKMVLSKGFYHIPLNEADMPKTAFCTTWGKLHFTQMPFGLGNIPFNV